MKCRTILRVGVVGVLVLCSSLTARAQTVVTVSAQANIFAAGGASSPGDGQNPPSISFTAGPGQTITLVSVTGSVSWGEAGGFNGPNGQSPPSPDASTDGTNLDSNFGISGIVDIGNIMFLTGVFLDDSTPLGSAPPRLNFTGNEHFTELSPLIGQTFFIGDGQTGGVPKVFHVPPTATRLFLGFADGAFFRGTPQFYDDNSGAVTAVIVVTGADCRATVTDVEMTDSHTLGIRIQGTFSESLATSKGLGVSTTVNGTPFSETHDVPPVLNGEQGHFFSFDLSLNGVRKFDANVRLQVRASMAEDGTECTSDEFPAMVVLPTIIVPGIGNDIGGNGRFPQLENHLANVLEGTGVVGDGYCTEASAPEYPTLETLSYDTNGASFLEGARELDETVERLLMNTWASKVNIVAHSKGGLVLRAYLASYLGPVQEAIFVQTPHLGAIYADHTVPMLFGLFNNLVPVWNWYRPTVRQEFSILPPNRELQPLNRTPLPPGYRYAILFSNNYATRATKTVLGNQFSLVPGDDVVPAFSQVGLNYDPNNPTAPPTFLPGFQGLFTKSIDGRHLGYLQNPAVMAELARCLINDTCQ